MTADAPRSMRTFREVTVAVARGWEELVAGALSEPPCTGIAFGPATLASPAPAPECELVRAYYPASGELGELEATVAGRLEGLARTVGVAELQDLSPRVREVPPEDWATTWRKVWKPQRVGRLCVVSLDWDGPLRPADVVLRLEPGAAFGTGRHATTRRALVALQQRLRPGDTVLDAGCGSGILAVAACLLGADRAVGYDCDDNAVAHAAELAEQNGVADRARFFRADLEDLERPLPGQPPSGFDGLLANLYGDLVRAHAAELARPLRSGAWFVVTGCRRDHRAPVLAALEGAGLRVEQTLNRGRWDAHAGLRA